MNKTILVISDSTGETANQVLDAVKVHFDITDVDIKKFSKINKKEQIDEIISNNLKGWKLERLSKMDRQILRISTYEILFTDIPYKVSINEAVELSKKYSEKDDSYKFINGVLKGIVETSTK